MSFLASLGNDKGKSETGLPDGLQPSGDLIEGFLNVVELYLRGVGELFDQVWCLMDVGGGMAQNLAPALTGKKKDAGAANQNSEAAQTIADLFALLHRFRDRLRCP